MIATLECIGNPVGGDSIGNATWEGVKLNAAPLDEAGVDLRAVDLVLRGEDEYSDSFPAQARDAGRGPPRHKDERRAFAGRARLPGSRHRPRHLRNEERKMAHGVSSSWIMTTKATGRKAAGPIKPRCNTMSQHQ